MAELYSDIPELGAEELAILRRKKIAEAMLTAGQMPVESIGTAGGAPIPISPLQGLAQMAKAYMGSRGLASAEKDYSGLADKRKAMVEAALAKYQLVKEGTPESVQYDQETGAINPSTMQAATQGNPQQAVADAITSNLPEVRDRAKFDYGESTRIADREETRKWKEADLQSAQDQRMLELQMKMADTKLAREERLAAQREMIQLTASLRQPQQEPAPSVTELVDPKDPSKMIKVDTRRYNEGAYLKGDTAGVIGFSGKEPTAAAKEGKVNIGKELLKATIDSMKDRYDELNRLEAIPSTARGTLSNTGSSIQSSWVGQVAGNVAGTEAQRIRNEIKSSRLQLLNAIRGATGMSSQQLNSNVELQTWLDSVTDPNKIYESNLGILDNLEKAYVGGGPSTPQRRASDANKRIKFDANGNQVP